MTTHKLTIELPDPVFEQLSRIAALTQESLETLVLQGVTNHFLPASHSVADEKETAIAQLQLLSDEQLLEIARSQISQSQQERHFELLEKNQMGAIDAEERIELKNLRMSADRMMLQKAYAWDILGKRGHPLPQLDELPIE